MYFFHIFNLLFLETEGITKTGLNQYVLFDIVY